MYLKAQLSAAMHSITPEASCSADVNQCSFTGSTAAMPVYTSLGSVHSNLTMALLLCLIFFQSTWQIYLDKYTYVCIYTYLYVCISCSLKIALLTVCGWGRQRKGHGEKTQSCAIFLNKTAWLKSLKLCLGKDYRAHPKAFQRVAVFTALGDHPADAAGQGPPVVLPLSPCLLCKDHL